MILWTIKLLNTVKKALAGRKYPHQLAWATAFGLLLGIVPHGNLLAVALVIVVLSLKINHAMVGLTAVATTFLVASRLDPISHAIGEVVLTHPDFHPIAVSLWQLPLIPWTDLNNTVVLGSSLVGVGALVPVFVVSYPLFRLIAPRSSGDADRSEIEASCEATPNRQRVDTRNQDERAESASESVHQVVMVDRGHQRIASPHGTEPVDFQEIPGEPAALAAADPTTDRTGDRIAVETRIDVIRMKGDRGAVAGTPSTGTTDSGASAADEQPMDEALNYLLRQLRDSQQRSAA